MDDVETKLAEHYTTDGHTIYEIAELHDDRVILLGSGQTLPKAKLDNMREGCAFSDEGKWIFKPFPENAIKVWSGDILHVNDEIHSATCYNPAHIIEFVRKFRKCVAW